MRVDVITLFPNMFDPVLGESILKRAQESDKLKFFIHDLRNFTHDKRRTVDDRPYGGGPGMLMKPEPIFEAVESVKETCGHECSAATCQTILLSPQGNRLSSSLAKTLSKYTHLILICGHYEGVDERVRIALIDNAVSIGDYVLTGGELPALVLIDTMSRYIPGVIGNDEATLEESFSDNLLEYPQYTRPPVFREMGVPEVLLSGDHENVAVWRKQEALARTKKIRPDLTQQS